MISELIYFIKNTLISSAIFTKSKIFLVLVTDFIFNFDKSFKSFNKFISFNIN